MERSLSSQSRWRAIRRDIRASRYLYLMLIPVVLNFVIFHYIPMGGILIAFQDYSLVRGIAGSEWVGFAQFEKLFNSYYFWPLVGNTLRISLKSILFGFPAPLLFALLLNEMRARRYKKFVQTISYLPNFISVVVVVSLLKQFLALDTGIVNNIIQALGGDPVSFMSKPEYFDTIFIGSGIWQEMGFSAIIYIAAISGIDTQLYDAASVDGAGRLRRIWHITLPGLAPTIIILFILRLGGILNVAWQKILLMQNGLTKEVSDVLQLFVYDRGLQSADYGFGTAVGLLQSAIGFVLVIADNQISKRVSDTHIF